MLRSVDLAGPELLERTEAQLRAQGVVDPYEWLALAELMQPGTTDRVRPAQASERHALVGRLLARAAEARPVVVWMEDVQWGADALAFALHLLKLPAPVLVLATVREDVLPQRRLEARLLDALLQAEGASELAVLPLADVHHRALIDALLLLDGDLATQVAERTQGNPLFAVQLVGDWVSRGVLEVGPRGFVLKPQERAALPDDIHQMWRQRVARVLEPFPRTALFALEVAAILGHTTEAREWQEALLEASLTVPPLLVIALMENRLAVPTDGGWAFAHGMLRESLVRGAEEAGRAPAHHAACARMLVHRHGHEAPGVAERLGGHHLAGGTPELALYPLRRAAEERLAASEFPQASALVDRRDEALDRMGAGPEDPRRVEGWVLRATILTLRGRFEDADAWARRARDTARRMSWRRILADALAAAGRVAHERGDQGTALNEFDEARRLYAGLGDRAGVARCLLGRGEALYRLGDLERAELVLDEALVLFQAEEDRAGIAQALLRLGVAALWRGRLDEARALCQRQLRVLEGLGDRFQQARCIAALGEVARQAGELDEAERAYRQALAMDEAIGSKSAWMDRLNLGLVLLARGDFAGAQRLSAQVARELGPGAEPSQRCLVLTQRLPSLAHAGDWAAWSVTLTEARLLLEETGLADGDLAWLLELAGAEALARGAVEPAQLVLALAAEQWRALGRPDRAAAATNVIPAT